MRHRRVWQVPSIALAGLVLSLLAPAASASAGNVPTAAISSPANGATVTGVVPVHVTGTANASQGDYPDTIELYLDGNAASTYYCSNDGSASCGVIFNWDSTGLTGQHTLQVQEGTANGLTVNSTVVRVTVTSAAPTASITSPANGATVTGTVQVQTLAVVDATQSDAPSTMELVIDGNVAATDYCANDGSKTCGEAFDWNTTGAVGTHTLLLRLTTANGRTASSAPVAVTVTSGAPSAAITSPVTGSTVTGIVPVQTLAVVDPTQSDAPSTMELVIDGNVATTDYCANDGSRTCGETFAFDTTGLAGPHTLLVRVTTVNGRTASSAPVVVTVTSAAPSAAITSPMTGSTVSGTVQVQTLGVVDPTQSDSPSTMELLVDGSVVATQYCANDGSRSCGETFAWDTSALSGPHTLLVRETTTNGRSADSAPLQVFVFAATKTTLNPVGLLVHGQSVTLKGRVVAPASGQGVAGAKESLRLTPAVGAPVTVTVTTNAAGYFSSTIKVTSISTVGITTAGTPHFGGSSTSQRLRVAASGPCKFAATVKRGQVDHGVCVLANLPKGTPVTLQYLSGGRWFTLSKGAAAGPTVKFGCSFTTPGTLSIRLVLGASRVFVASTGRPWKLAVT